MVSKNMTNSSVIKDRPVFIPPRKRTSATSSSKKTIGCATTTNGNGVQNCNVDHIVTIQNRQKLSPSNPGLEEDLIKTSLILKNKQPLPQLPGAASQNHLETNGHDRSANSTQRSTKSTKSTKSSHSVGNLVNDDKELQNFENICQGNNRQQYNYNRNEHQGTTTTTTTTAAAATPSSYSESSLIDTKLSKSHDCLSNRSSSKKRVNICTDLLDARNARSPRNSTSPEIANYEDVESGETSVLNADDYSLERYNNAKKTMDNKYLTMTGTIKRGKKKGQNLDLQINISREELEQINAMAIATETNKKQNLCCSCSLDTGLHIFLLSLFCLPFVTLISSIYSFYIGTLTWYNMFNFFNEEKSYVYKFFMCPILILAYPVGIVVCTLGLGIYSGVAQLSLQFNSWFNEVCDIEKGFYGWLCSFLHLSDCSPYEVIILTDIRMPQMQEPPRINVNTSTEDLSL